MTDRASAFEAHADRQISGPHEARIRSGKPRAAALVEQRKQLSRRRLIDSAFVALREKHGSPPFDDALPGEPLTAFNEIRKVFA